MTRQGLSLRERAVGIVRRLRKAGHEAYLAGGCVRDALLGIEPKDYDVATDARPEDVRKLFRWSRFVGEAFGVVLVYSGRHPAPGVEVATFRTEWGYEDGRRPSGVSFTDAEHDAQRRDFTVNGLFADPLDDSLEPVEPGAERIIDYVGGRADLEAKVLRAIGEPGERFEEDYLRMLRAARFAARLGFEIDPKTAEAVRASADKLAKISRERIGQEVKQMLTGADPVRSAELVQSLMLDGPTLNETHTDIPLLVMRGVAKRIKAQADGYEDSSPPEVWEHNPYGLMLAAWMLDRVGVTGSIEEASTFVETEAKARLAVWRKALCLSNGDRDSLGHVLGLLPRLKQWPELDVAKRKRLLADPGWADTWLLACELGPGDFVAGVSVDAAPLIEQGVAPEPFVSGDDLLAMGFEAGPAIGDLLEQVYDAQLDGRVSDRDEALEWAKGLSP